MKIGIALDRKSNHRKDRNYFGETKYWEGMDHLVADLNIGEVAEKSFDLTKHLWSREFPVPVGSLDASGHGEDAGIIFMFGKGEATDVEDFNDRPSYEVISRISIGRKAKEAGLDKHLGEIDLSNPFRIHLSVYAARQFFPEGRNDLKQQREQLNFSFRWLGEQYDSWNFLNEINDLNEKNYFHGTRTTWATSILTDIVTNSKRNSEERAKDLLRIKGRKNPSLSLSESIPCKNYTSYPERLDGREAAKPLIGYEEIQEQQLNLPKRTQVEIESMTPMEGAEFLFGEILPIIERKFSS